MFPSLLESHGYVNKGDRGRAYSRSDSDYIKTAKECLLIKNEMDRQIHGLDSLQEDPEVLITDILIQD